MLKEVFISLISKYSENQEYNISLWNETKKKYSKNNRYYHNLTHLENLYKQLSSIKSKIKDWDIVVFTLFYHDFVYNVLKQDNEAQSAEKAMRILNSLSINAERINLCKHMILATKGHQISQDNDINYFTDADLSILGSYWTDYQIYYRQVRKEYIFYPDFMYKKGRIKVLQNLLAMHRIYKTDHFYNTLENQAKKNIQQEIHLLSK